MKCIKTCIFENKEANMKATIHILPCIRVQPPFPLHNIIMDKFGPWVMLQESGNIN